MDCTKAVITVPRCSALLFSQMQKSGFLLTRLLFQSSGCEEMPLQESVDTSPLGTLSTEYVW